MAEMIKRVVSPEDKKLVLNFYEKIYSNLDNLSYAYNEVSTVYDEVCNIIGCESFKKLTKDLATFLKHEDLESRKILDVGCGSGLLGQSLHNEGFRKIDGLDLSESMLKICKSKGCYEKFFNVGLTTEPTPGIKDNTYDIAVSSGCFVEGHIPLNTLFELARIVKPGGYIFYTLHDPNYTMDYMNWHGKLIQQKKAKLISMQLGPYRLDYKNNYETTYGYYVLFKVL